MVNRQDIRAPVEDPNTTIVVVAPNGDVYKLTQSQWMGVTPGATKITDPQELFLPGQVRAVNGYVAFPPSDGAGIGLTCTIVNLQAILKNQRALKVSTTTETVGAGAVAEPGAAPVAGGARAGGRAR